MFILREIKRFSRILYVAIKYFVLYRLRAKYRKLPKWVRLRMALEDLGATFIKLGQFLATRFDLLPLEYCSELAHLYDQVRPFPYEKVRSIIKQELRADPNDIFLRFDPHPLASASLGQVHLAMLHTDETVAVKIQRPEAEKIVKIDLHILFRLVRLVDAFSFFKRIELRPAYNDFSQWTLEELNYTHELNNAEILRGEADDNPLAKFPIVYRQYSTEKVLTTEYLEGVRVSKLLKIVTNLDLPPAAINGLTYDEAIRLEGIDLPTVAQNLVENFLEQSFVHGFFHADPHPANLIVQSDNIIGYVDFGIVASLDEDFRRKMMRYMQAVADKDIERAYREFLELVTMTPETDMISFEREFKRNLRGWAAAVSNGRVNYQHKSIARLTFQNLGLLWKYSLMTRMDILAFYKTMMTIDSITLQLVPDFDSARAVREFFEKLRCRRIEQRLDPEYVWKRFEHYGLSYFGLLDKFINIVDQLDKGQLAFTVKFYDLGRISDTIQKELREGLRRSLVIGGVLLFIGAIIVGVKALRNDLFQKTLQGTPAEFLAHASVWSFIGFISIVIILYLFGRFFMLRRRQTRMSRNVNLPF